MSRPAPLGRVWFRDLKWVFCRNDQVSEDYAFFNILKYAHCHGQSGLSMNARVQFCLIAVVGTLRDLFECIYIRLHTLIPMNKFSSRKSILVCVTENLGPSEYIYSNVFDLISPVRRA